MSDYDLQYQADLEKAQALSLESLALEQFRKQIRTNTEADAPLGVPRPRLGPAVCPPALPPPPRRPARRARTCPRSASNSPPLEDAQDLISFTAPPPANKGHIELKECIEHIHRLNQQTEQLALVPLPKSGTKLTRSNSSASAYSPNSPNIMPYPTNNASTNQVNPLISFPSNSPFIQVQYHCSPNTPNYLNSQNNGYETANLQMGNNFGASNRSTGLSINGPVFVNNQTRYSSPTPNNLYPNLGSVPMVNAMNSPYQYPPINAGITPVGITQPFISTNAGIYPQLNVFPRNDCNKNVSPDPSALDVLYSAPSIKSSASAQSLSSAPSKKSMSISRQNLLNETVEKTMSNSRLQKNDFNIPVSKSNSADVINRDITNTNTRLWNDNINLDFGEKSTFTFDENREPSEASNQTFKSHSSGGPFLSPGGHSNNLIDLAANTRSGVGSVRVSVLEAFDPLMSDQNNSEYMMCSSECSGSVYDEYDPLDFLYGGNETPKETPVYATVNRRAPVESPLPSPPPKSFTSPPSITRRSNTQNSKLYESVTFVKTRKHEPDLVAFLDMVKDVRAGYVYSDATTNPGCAIASRSDGQYPAGTSIKLLVYHHKPVNPVTFTCDVECTVEHVILHVICELEGGITEDTSIYTLRVWGMSEYLTTGSYLKEYDYVRQCVRLEKDILLCLQANKDTSLARTERDDTRDNLLTMEELLPNQGSIPPISYHNLSILLETLERELTRLATTISGNGGCPKAGAAAQAVKAICTLLGGVETISVSSSLSALMHACSNVQGDSSIMKPEIVSDAGDYSTVSLKQATLRDTIGLHCQRLREAVKSFIALYCRSNRVDFQLEESHYSSPGEKQYPIPLASVTETALFCVEGVHRPPVNWNHDEFIMHAQIYHGTRPLKGSKSTQPFSISTTGFYPRIMFETWLIMDEISIANLPKEARLVLTLNGRTLATPDSQNGASSGEKDKAAEANQKEPQEKQDDDDEDGENKSSLIHIEQEELGWTAIQLFDYNGILLSGSYVLPLWPVSADKRLGPAPDLSDYPLQPHPVVHIEIPSYSSGGVTWQEDVDSEIYSMSPTRHSFEALDKHTQQQLMHLVEQGPYQRMPTECREILWEKRHYLIGIPGAMPLVLLASMSWDAFSKRQLMHLLDQWTPPSPHDALHLLLPCFPDEGVRERAVRWLGQAPADALSALAPQLCSALRYERHAASPLARLLLCKAMESPRFAHRLYWQLVHDIPGNSPQNSTDSFLGISLDGEASIMAADVDAGLVASARWVRRNQMVLRALLAIVGENLSGRLLKQQLLVKSLTEIASNVKNCKESHRNRNLQSGVENLAPLLKSNNVCLPLSISQEVHDIDIKSCSYFPSNTLPMKINFISSDNAIVPAIFKVGDDLRQDSLVLQVMRVMDHLWLKEGLDMRMVTFEAVPTQLRKGMIEMVCSAETLRAIQVEWGLTGSFKDKPIAEWLAKHNPSELEYERAVTNFTASCAGYSVATYLLGICDRHNDNIMLKTSGHLFHIDFGKFLGDAQMFGNFKRDRTPFVLTPDMAYVINGGERPSQRFHHFVELCCTAFNIVRKHHNLILHLFSLMASTGIPGVSAAAVGYVRAALLPGQTAAEAAAAFARLIHSALRSRFTPINFFLHNLAQFRAGDQPSSSTELLSFMPKTYTITQEGRLTKVEVLGYEKRYDPEKYYVYALRVFRQEQATSVVLYRSYKHFTELYQKICLHFPLAKVHSLPVGLHMGRSNTKQAAERRFGDVQAFLTSLFQLADEIAHSDLVYTFFHPLLRDQQDVGPQRIKNKNEIQQQNVGDGVGSLKISIQYSAGVLSVLILHAQSLPMILQGLPPSPYVKVYLVPDRSKETKRKTRVLKRNCHPSFMEMLEYRLPLEVVRGRELQATVWHHDPLQENQFLGGVQLPLYNMQLTAETTEWYPLQYIPR